MRTRVGYCGGTEDHPTYRRIGDHSETVEIDYDPRVLRYEDLLDVFFASHDPAWPAYSVQYRSAVFYRTDEERIAAEAAVERRRADVGPVFTSVEPFARFWRAEAYHQKYRLRQHHRIHEEFAVMLDDDDRFVDSTAVARVNGWLDGCGAPEQIERELPLTGLDTEARSEVMAYAMPSARMSRR